MITITLPAELSKLFVQTQKSYKMVLILALLSEMSATGMRQISQQDLKKRFLALLQERESSGLRVDEPPRALGSNWANVSPSQILPVISTPIQALSHLFEQDTTKQTIGFKKELYEQWDNDVLIELYDHAIRELSNYYEQSFVNVIPFSIQHALSTIMSKYLIAKKETFAGHSIGTFMRQEIPNGMSKLPFIHNYLKIQGSVGQGNWANIPWIAIMDRRITESTQQGEYICYLFTEDMRSVYLTLAQGVTIPLKDKGRTGGYRYLEEKSQQLRELLPFEGMKKDSQIHLTTIGLGQDYQVSTIAYYKYEADNLPDDGTLISDLSNLVDNYSRYVQSTQNEDTSTQGAFSYTIAHLRLGQGVVNFLGAHHPEERTMDHFLDQRSNVLFSGDDVKHPKERIQHLCRAFSDLGVINIHNKMYTLTDFGIKYFQARDISDIWEISLQQSNMLREYIDNNSHSDLIIAIQNAVEVVGELSAFTLPAFTEAYIRRLGTSTIWGEVTQSNRSRFMLNWLQELHYVERRGDQFVATQLPVTQSTPRDTLPVAERLSAIKKYIQQKGFAYPDYLIENFYLSLKSKPFVILAGVSGTGKTKLVKLFAEALGATNQNKQFTLIPVRPDWSDPTDLLGYKDLSGSFRIGPLTSVLLEANQPGNRHKPYFICLDEMNLARVEHYFSDLLSVLETQEWKDTTIVTEPLIRAESLVNEDDRKRLDQLHLPDNVYLIGTVNMDETTHPFSKKVLDRANTIEFNYINLSQFPQNLEINDQQSQVAPNIFLRSEYLQLTEVYAQYRELIEHTTTRLVQVNDILEKIHSHVGFRIRDAICFYLIYNERFGLLDADAAFDLQFIQKILPRIQGSSQSIRRVLLQLLEIALGKRLAKEEYMDDLTELFKDLDKTQTSAKYPQSARKLAFMLRRLDEDGFTSYWLS